jgi:hypothetical protein
LVLFTIPLWGITSNLFLIYCEGEPSSAALFRMHLYFFVRDNDQNVRPKHVAENKKERLEFMCCVCVDCITCGWLRKRDKFAQNTVNSIKLTHCRIITQQFNENTLKDVADKPTEQHSLFTLVSVVSLVKIETKPTKMKVTLKLWFRSTWMRFI